MSVYEIRYGLSILPKGKRRKQLEVVFETIIVEGFEGRVLDFDIHAANESARVSAKLRREGIAPDIQDVLIAGIALARRGTLATRNIKHFVDTGVELVNPWGD